jgi:hypothetical protein
LIEAVDHISVHIGAAELKEILYNTMLPKWNRWTNNFPLAIDAVIMRDKSWVELRPNVPDTDIIAKQFFHFKTKKSTVATFKAGKAVVQLHVSNDLYDYMILRKETDELREREETEIEPSMAANFTVGPLIFDKYITKEILGRYKEREETSPKYLTYT